MTPRTALQSLVLCCISMQVPSRGKLVNSTASNVSMLKGGFGTPGGDDAFGSNVHWGHSDKTEAPMCLQLLSSQLQLHSLEARCEGLAKTTLLLC